MKLTDAKVARALGWRKHTERRNVWVKGLLGDMVHGCPAFTTSLDAIVAEVEARGLWCRVDGGGGFGCSASVSGAKDADNEMNGFHDTSKALALCAALLQFLKETR